MNILLKTFLPDFPTFTKVYFSFTYFKFSNPNDTLPINITELS